MPSASAALREVRHRFYGAVAGLIRDSQLGKVVSRNFAALHRTVYRSTGGRVWHHIGLGQILLLTTKGHRSGRLRTQPLTTVALEAGRYAVIGSNAGGEKDPAWANNLRADPAARVQVGDRAFDVHARLVTEQVEWDALFQGFVDLQDHYTDYVSYTTRRFPIFVLEPRPH